MFLRLSDLRQVLPQSEMLNKFIFEWCTLLNRPRVISLKGMQREGHLMRLKPNTTRGFGDAGAHD